MNIESKYYSEAAMSAFTAMQSENTKTSYKSILSIFFRNYGLRDESRILESAIEFFNVTLANSSQIAKKAALIKYFNEVDENVVSKIRQFKPIKEEKEEISLSFSNEKLKFIIQNSTYGGVIEFLASTGMRISEALSVKFSDIDENGEFKVMGKGKKIRRIYLKNHQEILKRIRTQCELSNDAIYVMQKGRKDYKLPNVISHKEHKARIMRWTRLLDKEFKEFGVDDFHPHSLRANYICTLANNNVPVHVIAKIVGHSNINTTMGYLQKNQEVIIRQAADSFSL